MKILGPATGYTDLLNEQTVDLMREEASKPSDFFPLRPSSAGKCTRELTYALNEFRQNAKYEKEPRSPESHRLLNLGGYIERHLLGHFEKFRKVFRTKYKQQMVELFRLTSIASSEGILIEGSMDTCFWSPEHKAVIDIKSKKDKFSAAFKTDWDATTDKLTNMKSVERFGETAFWVEDLKAFLVELRDPFFAENFLQLNGYACTKFMKDRGVDHAAIVQYNKNDSRIREIRFKPSDELFEVVRVKFQAALDAVEAGDPTLAPKDFSIGSIKCAFCDFKKECWGGKDTLKAYFKTFPAKVWPEDAPPDLEPAYKEYNESVKAIAVAEAYEEIILDYMVKNHVEKIKFADGKIFEAKLLQSPRPHFELRKGKL